MKTFDVLSMFLALTSKTYPAGTEAQLKKFLPKEIKKDRIGNYFIKIGESKTIFSCHLDTYGKEQINVTHQFVDKQYVYTDQFSILGADDKAGMTVLLYMIKHQVPGLYYFFVKEEVGGIGSKNIVAKQADFFKDYDRMISFDRRGTQDIITHQKSGRCCSDFFATALCDALNEQGMNYKPSVDGYFTDSDNFISLIPECTNISVGYYDEHTEMECQDIIHLERLAQSCCLIDWEALPVLR